MKQVLNNNSNHNATNFVGDNLGTIVDYFLAQGVTPVLEQDSGVIFKVDAHYLTMDYGVDVVEHYIEKVKAELEGKGFVATMHLVDNNISSLTFFQSGGSDLSYTRDITMDFDGIMDWASIDSVLQSN